MTDILLTGIRDPKSIPELFGPSWILKNMQGSKRQKFVWGLSSELLDSIQNP